MKSKHHPKNQPLASIDAGAMKHAQQLADDAIAAKAYQFCLEQGCPEGR
ncbi:MAG TPA: hypothetical protein VG347_13220 [Verrucomicrobiae bacterium]|nr:hypothetical protein [Verrucomicrobiae bacterium]